ncbi:MAG: class I SAM-dependent methyltransferase [Oscillospiraceae bacterium]|nr:class I SAM-dependent methyltransferase [Oscillospiraceae bacterium]
MDLDNHNQFGIFAKYYDILNYNANYKKVADYIENVFEIYKKKPGLVLDLACGTGNLAIELDNRGYDMTGLDLSNEMLSVAAAKNKNNILWINQDMSSFELYGTVDAIICCFDSLNYIQDEENIKKCFMSVYNYLNPGGLFIFDINSKYKFEVIYARNNFVLEKKNIFCSWQNNYNKKNKTCDFYLTFFVRQPDGGYKRYIENQREKYYGEEFLTETLLAAGFGDIKIFYDFDCTGQNITKEGREERVCFAAMKE